MTLLRATTTTSHSNSRDSVLNRSQDYLHHQGTPLPAATSNSQHNLRYGGAAVSAGSLLTTTPTNNAPPPLPL